MNFGPSQDFLDSLGWTLLHFLWQGLIIAALAAGALRLLRHKSANARYLTACCALLLMAAAPVATFYSLNRTEETPTPKFTVQIFDAPDVSIENPQPHAAPAKRAPVIAPKPITRKTTFPEALEASLPWLVAAWSLGVLALSCRLFAGWLFIQKLRRSAVLVEPLQARLKQLAAHIGVSRPVRLLQSALVEVPTVIGWLRPVILLPASCLTGLTPAQLESILAHELAHIRRHDYLINLLQNVVETLLFYHPAVWWISHRIRAEREHCCDDLAVKTCGDAAAYARALATLEELRPAPAPFALAASGASLLDRIRRLAGQPERSAVRPAWPVAGVIALLLLALLAAELRNNPASAQPTTESPHTNQIISASASTNSPAATNSPATQPLVTPFPLAQPTPTDHQPSTDEYNRSLGEQRALASQETNSPFNVVPAHPRQNALPADPTLSGLLQKEITAESEIVKLKNDLGDQHPEVLRAQNDLDAQKQKIDSRVKELTQGRRPANPAAPANDQPLPQINIKTRWAAIDAAMLGTNTFMSFFPTNDPQTIVTVPAIFEFIDYYTVQPTNPAEPSYEVFLHGASNAAPLATFLTEIQTKTAIKKLELQDGVDLLTCPEITTESGRQCQVQAVDIQNFLVGNSPPGTTNGPRVVKNIPFGPTADLIPSVSRDADKIDLTVIGNVSEFVGYEDPATVTNKNGKPMPKNWAIPHFRNQQFHTQVSIANAQTLVLGAAPVPITTIEKRKNKVPLLGDIPLFGRLFRSTKTSTTTAQKSLVLLVTPTLVNADGTRFVPPTEPARVAELVREGKSLYLAGALDEAKAKFEQAVKTDPTNAAAFYYLRLIEEKHNADATRQRELQTQEAPARVEPSPHATQSNPNPFNRSNLVHTSEGRQAIFNKLDQIRVPEVAYDHLPLGQVIRDLSDLAKTYDPEKTGIDFFISREPPTAFTMGNIDPATGLPPFALPVDVPTNLADVTVTIKPALQNVRLADVVNAVTKYADAPIKYFVIDYTRGRPKPSGSAVMFSFRNTNEIPLEIRAFHVDPVTFRQGLESISSVPLPPRTNMTRTQFLADKSNSADQFQAAIREFFTAVGVDFSTNNPANVGKAFVWNDKKGILTVRATASDLDMLAAAIENLNLQPPMINFKVKVAQVAQKETGAPNLGTVSGILSDAQAQVALQTLDQRDGVQLFTAPEITVESGRKTQIVTTNTKTNRDRPAPGPTIDLLPFVAADEFSIELTVTPTIREFIGYDGPGTLKMDMEGNPRGSQPLPHFRLRQYTNNVTLFDGQTAVFSGVITQSLEKQNAGSNSHAPTWGTNTMIFITATIVNPDGTPYHSAANRASFQTNVAPPSAFSGSRPIK